MISDEDDLHQWLQAHNQQAAICLAARAALRALPGTDDAFSEQFEDLLWQTLRSTLRATVAGKTPTDITVAEGSSFQATREYTAAAVIASHAPKAGSAAKYAFSASIARSGDAVSIAKSGLSKSVGSVGRVEVDTKQRSSTPPRPSSNIDQSQVPPSLEAKTAEKSLLAASLDADAMEETHPTNVFDTVLWPGDMPGLIAKNLQGLRSFWEHTPENWAYWERWYDGFLNGNPLDWHVQLAISSLPDEDWHRGPEWVAKKIKEIEGYQPPTETLAPTPLSTQKDRDAISGRVVQNRDALALSIANVLIQIEECREQIRGKNDLDSGYRDELMAFLDALTTQLNELMKSLPLDETVTNENASKLVLWLHNFKPLITHEAAKYVSPENVAQTVIPTTIILGCTGVGALLGMPVAGSVVGGLITGQLKPGKAADDLIG